MIKKEWRSLFKNKFMLAALAAIILIPSIYTTIFLGSMWDPYGKVDHLPVAIVNNDEAAEYNGKTLNIGEELVDSLKENNSLKFTFTNQESADEGLENGTYYMVISIPANFSQNATTLLSDNPEKMVLDYKTNPGASYIASKLSESALISIQNSISETVTKTYSEVIFEQLGNIGDGMNDAAEGAGELYDGLVLLSDGNAELSSGIKTLSDSMLTFTDGIDTYSDGISEYLQGAESADSGAQSLASGAKTLSDGMSRLNSAVADISLPAVELDDKQKETIASAASSGVSKYAEQLSSGIGSAVSENIQDSLTSDSTVEHITAYVLQDVNIQQMISALTSAGYSEAQAQSLIAGIVSGTLNGAADNISSTSIENAVSNTISDTMSTVAAGAATSGAEGVIEQVNSALSDSGSMFDELKSSVAQLNEGASSLYSGASELAQGTNKLVSNNSALSSGIASIQDGANQLADGTEELYNGSLSVSDGLIGASDGTSTLTSSLSDASDEISDTTSVVSDDTHDMFASPVDDKKTEISVVKNNGHGMAPYMMTAALWVACLSFCMFYPINKRRGNGVFSFWASKASVMYPVALIWSAVMVLALCIFNGFEPEHLMLTFAVSCLAGVMFMSIVYFFNSLFGPLGSFICLVFMVLQLSCSTGSYPAEISGDFVSSLVNYMPFTYSIRALRAAISDCSGLVQNVLVMAGITLLFVILTLIVISIKEKRRLNKPSESALSATTAL